MPITVTGSSCPLALALSAAQPFSSLKNVIRSISPLRDSTGRDVGEAARGGGGLGVARFNVSARQT